MGPFCPNLGKNEFSWKKGLYQVLDIPSIHHRGKNQKKTIEPFVGKMPDEQTDRETDRQTDQTDNGDFTGPSVGRASNKIRQ